MNYSITDTYKMKREILNFQRNFQLTFLSPNLNMLRKFAFSLLKATDVGTRISLQKKRMKAALSPTYLSLILAKK